MLRAGSAVTVSMVAKTVPNGLIIPAQAVVADEEGKKSVMVVGSDGAAHKREVETGIQSAASVQIVTGLKPGEQVVTVGAYGLPDNTKVKVEAPAVPGKEEDQAKDKGESGGN